MKCLKFEVYRWEGDRKNRIREWIEISESMRTASNLYWQLWESWHFQQGTHLKLREFAETLKEWHRDREQHERDITTWKKTTANRRGPKPKLRNKPKLDAQIHPIPPELQRDIEQGIVAAIPCVHRRCISLLTQLMRKSLTAKSTKGSWQKWQAVLLSHEGRPSFTHLQPIPIDCQNFSLVPPNDRGEPWKLRINAQRIPRDGKLATSIADIVQLRSSGKTLGKQAPRRIRGIMAMVDKLERIVNGDSKIAMKGSKLFYNQSQRKWFVAIAIEEEKEVEPLDSTVLATLRPGKYGPWRMRTNRGSFRVGGVGKQVKGKRKWFSSKLAVTKENYRWSGKNSKGHGRSRAMQVCSKISPGWAQFCKNYNTQVANKVVQICKDRGIGTLVFFQPDRECGTCRFLENAGKVEGVHNLDGWKWFSMKTILEGKCSDAEIKFIVHKMHDKSSREDKLELASCG